VLTSITTTGSHMRRRDLERRFRPKNRYERPPDYGLHDLLDESARPDLWLTTRALLR